MCNSSGNDEGQDKASAGRGCPSEASANDIPSCESSVNISRHLLTTQHSVAISALEAMRHHVRVRSVMHVIIAGGRKRPARMVVSTLSFTLDLEYSQIPYDEQVVVHAT